MKLFQAIQKYLIVFGFKSSQQSQKSSINATNLVVLTIFAHFSIATTVFLLFDAESFKQIVDSFYPASSAILATLNFIVIICNSSKLFKLIESFENTIQMSKMKNVQLKYDLLHFISIKSIVFNCVFVNRIRKSSIEKNLRRSKSGN